MRPRSLSRRDMLGSLALAGASLLSLPRRSATAQPAGGARVDPADPAARALGYVENATRVDRTKFPTFLEGSSCENCLQLEGKPGEPYRPCKIFNGKLVAAGGWCSAWTAEI